MKLKATDEGIIQAMIEVAPGAHEAAKLARDYTNRCKGEISTFQGAVLYALTVQLQPKRILEIGSAYGYSAAVMSLAHPDAEIIGLNPQAHEVERAEFDLFAHDITNVEFIVMRSWDYLKAAPPDDTYDMIFVDGDHNRVKQDFPWFNRLNTGGLMVFHDYSPANSWRPCPPVFEALNEKARVFRDFDVLISDLDGVGIAGWYKKEGEEW